LSWPVKKEKKKEKETNTLSWPVKKRSQYGELAA